MMCSLVSDVTWVCLCFPGACRDGAGIRPHALSSGLERPWKAAGWEAQSRLSLQSPFLATLDVLYYRR